MHLKSSDHDFPPSEILDCFESSHACPGPSLSYEVYWEHDQWWVLCHETGAAWSVVDAEGGDSIGGFDFEQVAEGNEL